MIGNYYIIHCIPYTYKIILAQIHIITARYISLQIKERYHSFGNKKNSICKIKFLSKIRRAD